MIGQISSAPPLRRPPAAPPVGLWRILREQGNIVWALMLRELGTRYGRDNIGFLWLIGEPLVFCAGVLVMWTLLRPPYEHGIPITPFVMTGYLPLTLLRHMIMHALQCVKVNAGLLYHRRITVLHMFVSRLSLEFIGVTFAFLVVFLVLAAFGLVSAPPHLGLVYAGWFLLAWLSFGLALILGAVAQMVDFVERIATLFTYILLPISGTFFMVAWVPPGFRKFVLYVPIIHCLEMIRSGFFGDAVTAYYSVGFVVACSAGTTLVGLLLLRFVRDRIEVE